MLSSKNKVSVFELRKVEIGSNLPPLTPGVL